MNGTLYFDGKKFYDDGMPLNDLEAVKQNVLKGMEGLREITMNSIMDVFHQFSLDILKSEPLKDIEGAAFASNWMRKSNIQKVLEENLGRQDVMENFVEINGRYVIAQPRGIVAHWIAGNIQTLGLFSLFQSMAVKNGNILRVPTASAGTLLKFLKVFSNAEYGGISGSSLLESVAIVNIPSSDAEGNESLSKIADARVIWGGEKAVKGIKSLPSMSHCEDIVFGPKYSFGVVDSKAIESGDLREIIKRFTMDVIFSDQISCTSPHVVFFESGMPKVMEIANMFADEFRIAAKKYPKSGSDPHNASVILQKRAEYGLQPDKKFIAPKETDWTILIDGSLRLEEPVGHRTLFLKPISTIFDILPLITRRVQTIGCSVYDQNKLFGFAKEAAYRGAARCVNPGTMNFFSAPWDGIYMINRLVCWDTLKFKIRNQQK